MATTIVHREILLKGRPGQPLEFYTRVKSPTEHLFHARGVSFADFAELFGKEILAGEALVYRMPPSLLNPSYWEPLAKENEYAVREKMGGIVTRQEDGQALLWRSDQIAKGRLLRDGIDVPIELLQGYVFQVSGPGLLQLAEAWRGGTGRLEFALFTKLASPSRNETLSTAHNDVSQLRISLPEERLIFTSVDDQSVRVVFGSRGDLRRAVSAVVRGFVYALTRHHVGYINERVLDSLIRVADGLGFTAHPERDFVNKHRTFEVHGQVGKTEWAVQLQPGQDPLVGDEKILIYYDRTSGIWAIAT
jgi:hypothetical protein